MSRDLVKKQKKKVDKVMDGIMAGMKETEDRRKRVFRKLKKNVKEMEKPLKV